MKAAALLVLACAPAGLCAQHVVVGPQVVFADYRETSANLHYRGSGGAATASFAWKKFGADVSFSGVTYKPTSDGTAVAQFKVKQFDVRLRYYIAGPASAELGFVKREADPEFEAQSVGAVRAGARLTYLLGPGVRMGLRSGLLFGSKFSGGGTSSAVGSVELGLGVGIDGLKGKLRITGDYEFQRIARKTDTGSGEVDVPIQQALGRVGVALAF